MAACSDRRRVSKFLPEALTRKAAKPGINISQARPVGLLELYRTVHDVSEDYGSLASRGHDNGRMSRCMTWRAHECHTRNNGLAVFEKFDPVLQWLLDIGKARPRNVVSSLPMIPFRPSNQVARSGKRQRATLLRRDRCPTHVIVVEVGVDDDVHIGRR